MLMTQIVPLPISMHHACLCRFNFFLCRFSLRHHHFSLSLCVQSENKLHDMSFASLLQLSLWQVMISRLHLIHWPIATRHSRNHRRQRPWWWRLFAPICLCFFFLLLCAICTIFCVLGFRLFRIVSLIQCIWFDSVILIHQRATS